MKMAHKTQEEMIPYFGSSVAWKEEHIRLHIGENLFGASPYVVEKLLRYMTCHHIGCYPDPSCAVLHSKLAQVYGIDAQHIVCGNGSEELLHLIPKALVSPGLEVVMPMYSFKGIRLGVMACGAVAVNVPHNPWHTYTADDLLACVNERTRMIVIDHPGNPTGSFLPYEELMSILQFAHERRIFVVIDGAYSEYAQYESSYVLDDTWVKRFPYVIIVRTFSKAYALAAIRLGWLHSHPDIVAAVTRLCPPYHVNALAQKAAVYALEDQAYMHKCVQQTIQTRQEVREALRPLIISPSATNFLAVPTQKPALAYAQKLLEHNILVSTLTDYGLDFYIKVSIGKPEYMRMFVDVFKKIDMCSSP